MEIKRCSRSYIGSVNTGRQSPPDGRHVVSGYEDLIRAVDGRAGRDRQISQLPGRPLKINNLHKATRGACEEASFLRHVQHVLSAGFQMPAEPAKRLHFFDWGDWDRSSKTLQSPDEEPSCALSFPEFV
jgi:hypothetical protein